MEKTRKILITGIVLLMVSSFMISLFPIYAYAADEFEHESDDDLPHYVDELIDAEITWKIFNASGVFADEDLQPNDLLRYKVRDQNTQDGFYEVKVSKKSWGENDFEKESGNANSSYFLIQRAWGESSEAIFLPQHVEYWEDADDIDKTWETFYETEWWDWKMLQTVTITYTLNETNYDKAKYSRNEGILLSRKTNVFIGDGETRGYLYVELYSYSGFLALSPWFYIIVVSIIIALIAIVIITISLLIQRRKRIYREIDEI